MSIIKYIFPLLFFVVGCSPIGIEVTPRHHGIASAVISKQNLDSVDVVIPDAPKVGDKCPECNDPPGSCGVGKVGDGTICQTCNVCKGDGKIDEEDLNGSTPEERVEDYNSKATENFNTFFSAKYDSLKESKSKSNDERTQKVIDWLNKNRPTWIENVEEKMKIKEVNQEKIKSLDRVVVYTSDTCGPCLAWKTQVMPKLIEVGWDVKVINAVSGMVPRFEVYCSGKKYTQTGYMDMTTFNSYISDARRK